MVATWSMRRISPPQLFIFSFVSSACLWRASSLSDIWRRRWEISPDASGCFVSFESLTARSLWAEAAEEGSFSPSPSAKPRRPGPWLLWHELFSMLSSAWGGKRKRRGATNECKARSLQGTVRKQPNWCSICASQSFQSARHKQLDLRVTVSLFETRFNHRLRGKSTVDRKLYLVSAHKRVSSQMRFYLINSH